MGFSPLPAPVRTISSELPVDRNSRGRDSGREPIPLALRHGERGAGALKAIIWTAILVAVAYVGIKVMPMLVNEYEFQDGIQNIARAASVNRPDSEKIRQAVLKEAEKDELQIAPEDVHIDSAGGNIRISADYSAVVDLKVYQWTLNFHPAASNNALF
jgi:hypothetical protein